MRSFALSLALFAPALASAADGRVDRVPQDFATIQQAVDEGTAPVILVAPGEWAGAVVDRPVEIRASSGASITSGPRASGKAAGFVLTDGASRSGITGFEFQCAGNALDLGVYSSTKRVGVADYVTVQGNTFRGCMQGVTNAGRPTDDCSPASVDGGQYWVVQDNVFDGFATRGQGGGIGVFLFNTRYADVLNNRFQGRIEDDRRFTTGGVVVAGCWDCTIAGNDFAVTGATAYWSAISNFGSYQTGAAASKHVLIADNDASADAAPHYDVNFRSYDSTDASLDENYGVAFIDHSYCGDGQLDTFEVRAPRR